MAAAWRGRGDPEQPKAEETMKEGGGREIGGARRKGPLNGRHGNNEASLSSPCFVWRDTAAAARINQPSGNQRKRWREKRQRREGAGVSYKFSFSNDRSSPSLPSVTLPSNQYPILSSASFRLSLPRPSFPHLSLSPSPLAGYLDLTAVTAKWS